MGSQSTFLLFAKKQSGRSRRVGLGWREDGDIRTSKRGRVGWEFKKGSSCGVNGKRTGRGIRRPGF